MIPMRRVLVAVEEKLYAMGVPRPPAGAAVAAEAKPSGTLALAEAAVAPTTPPASPSLLDDPQARQRMADAGRAFAAMHRGATGRCIALIEPLLAARLEQLAHNHRR